MRRIIPIFLFAFLCSTIAIIAASDLFPQRGMNVTVRTQSGENFKLYKDSYALVIGNGAYPAENGWNPLPGAVNDVKEVAKVLERHGFNVTLKIDVTKEEFNNAFSDFIFESGKDKDNRLLFYYAGHGYTMKSATGEDLGYLVMLDTPTPEHTGKFDLSSIDMVKFVSDSKKIHAKHVLFMFDSCFSGTVLNLRNKVTPSHITDRIKNPVRQFITAGRADEPVPDKSEFKKAFINLLEGHVEEPTPDGYLTGVELGDYLYRTVPKYSSGQHPQHGKIHDQQLNTGDFVFVLAKKGQDSQDTGLELDTIALLNITSNPSGATVFIDSVPIGKTPLKEYQLDTGVGLEKKVNIGLELTGYKSRVKNISIQAGKVYPWDVNLEEKPVSELVTHTDTSLKNNESRNKTEIPLGYTYIGLMSGDVNTITPTNHHSNWGPLFISEKTRSGYYYSLAGHVKRSDRSGWNKVDFISNQYDRDFGHWIYLHAKSTLVYDLSDRKYSRFQGDIGLSNSWPERNDAKDVSCIKGGSIEITFLINDIETYKSGVIIGADHNKPIRVEFDIPVDAKKLTLIVSDAGDGIGCDHWTLGNARLVEGSQLDIPTKKIKEETNRLTPDSRVSQTILGNDGVEMVLVPSGDFLMGSPSGVSGNAATTPAHMVYLDAFYIDKYEVTVGQYNKFVLETGYRPLDNWMSNYSPTDKHPVVGVSWNDAMAYAKWAGKRLPTEAEWEKAARGGFTGEENPWGEAPFDGTQGNFADYSLSKVSNKDSGDDSIHKDIDDGYAYTAPVGSYPSNGYHLFDMSGNVWEWCFDAYDEGFYANSPRRNPIAKITIIDAEKNIPIVNSSRVARGNSWYDPHIWIASRLKVLSTDRISNIGFRCAKSAAQ